MNSLRRRRLLAALYSAVLLGFCSTESALAKPPASPPSTPANLTAVALDPYDVQLGWQASSVKRATIQSYSILKDGLTIATVPATQTTYKNAGLSPSTTYRYQVSALSSAGLSSALSSPVSVTTPSGSTSVTPPPPAPTPVADNAVPAEYFGMTIGGINFVPWPTQIQFHGLRNWDVWIYSNLQQKYLGPTWNNINYANGSYDWALFDIFFQKCNANNVKEIVFNLGFSPTWATAARDSTLPPDDLAKWDVWVEQAVKRARDVWGRTGVNWEIWNEVGHSSTYRGQFYNGTWNQLAAMTKRAYQIIKVADPTAKVLNASVQGNEANYLSLYFAADAGGGESATKYFDIINTHHYFGFTENFPEEYVTRGYYRNYRNLFNSYGINDRPWWDTETNTYANPNNHVLHGALIARHWMLNWSEGIVRSYYYAYDYDNVGQLWSGSGTGINGTGVAYNELRKWLVGSTLQGPIAQSGTVWTGYWTRTFPSGYQAMSVWNTAGNSEFTVPAGYNSYRNLAGVSSPIPYDRKVTIGVSPLWFESLF
jgi:hypothetical protein